jgi:uncharacterized membrane protein YdjX (TVP38/TMEM64 family)
MKPSYTADEQPSLRPLALWVVVVGVLFVLAPLILVWLVPGLKDPVAIREYVLGFGTLAPVVFVLLQVAQVLIAPIPGQVTAVAGGYLFGPWLGVAYSLLGMAIGSTIAFVLSRRFGRPYVTRHVGSRRVARFDAFIERTGVGGVFVLFLLPGLPDDVVCFVAGITTIPIRVLVLVAVLGRAPAVFVASFIGAELAGGQLLVAGVITGLLVIVWGVGYYHRARLLTLLDRYLSHSKTDT